MKILSTGRSILVAFILQLVEIHAFSQQRSFAVVIPGQPVAWNHWNCRAKVREKKKSFAVAIVLSHLPAIVKQRYDWSLDYQYGGEEMKMEIEYYSLLGVSYEADEAEIKKAYRDLAKQFHPDANPHMDTSAIFEQLNRAYEVLKDPELRERYDIYGLAGLSESFVAEKEKDEEQERFYTRNQGGFSPFPNNGRQTEATSFWDRQSSSSSSSSSRNPHQTVGTSNSSKRYYSTTNAQRQTTSSRRYRAYSSYTPPNEYAQHKTSNQPQQPQQRARPKKSTRARWIGKDLRIDWVLPRTIAASGGEQTIRYKRMATCDECDGTGVDSHAKLDLCPHCLGTGALIDAKQKQRSCHYCRGTGQSRGADCSTCDGQGIYLSVKEITIRIPPGIENGSSVRLKHLGDAGPVGGPAGDLFLFITIK